MRALTTLIFAVLLTSTAHAQINIFSALHFHEQRDYKTARAKKITKTNIFYNTKGNQVDNYVLTFDPSGMLLNSEQFGEANVLLSRSTFTNDTIHQRTLSRRSESWSATMGYSTRSVVYNYDSNYHLTGITEKDAAGRITGTTTIACNEKGHPVELTTFDGNGHPYGKETTSYLYDKNKAVTMVLRNDGKVLSSDTILISFTNAHLFPEEGKEYNAQGDLIRWTSKHLDGTLTHYEADYSYDSLGNCTEEIIYKVTFKRNGKSKRSTDRIFRKAYSYW